MQNGRSVLIGMAAQPRRIPNLLISIPPLVKQCDQLIIHLNGASSKTAGARSAVGKLMALFGQHSDIIRWTWTSENKGDMVKADFLRDLKDPVYAFTVDDDIRYPDDYVERMVNYIEQENGWGMMCVHASSFDPRRPRGFTNRRKMFDFQWKIDTMRRVMMPGTGTVAFRTDIWNPPMGRVTYTNMLDVWFACFAAEKGLPTYVVPREAGWLKSLPPRGSAICKSRPTKEMEQVVTMFQKHLVKMHKRLGMPPKGKQPWSGS